jgi:hypothetical protein
MQPMQRCGGGKLCDLRMVSKKVLLGHAVGSGRDSLLGGQVSKGLVPEKGCKLPRDAIWEPLAAPRQRQGIFEAGRPVGRLGG